MALDSLTAAALKRFVEWWIAHRPFSKEKREARKERRRRRREGLPPLEETQMDKLKEILAKYRTSTKAGVAGFLPLLGLLPFYDEVNGYLLQACQSEDGPVVFLVGGAIVWVTMFAAARVSKTPDNPGKL